MEMIPEQTCVESCTKDFKSLTKTYTNEEMNKDGFIASIQNVLSTCKAENTKNGMLNNTEYFSCNKDRFKILKDKYSYLN